jgi:3,4-dihydroxy 2-butanone 4-phosphate synthase/GTP cyclohydrolase II
MDADGNMMRRDGLIEFAKKHELPMITIQQIVDYRNNKENHLLFVSKAKLPTQFGELDIQVFENYLTGIEQVVVSSNTTQNKPIVRIHSECLTGDVFGSKRCDCQDQLHQSLAMIAANGNGYLIYIKGHEGRGIGIGNKIAAYALQENGMNTYEANEALGLPKDKRNYVDAIWILKALYIDQFQLISNNPEKIDALKKAGFDFEVIQVASASNDHNLKYLSDKIELAKHTLKLN